MVAPNITLNSDLTVAERLKTIRKEHKLGQKKMADVLDVSISAYQNYEKGNRPVTKHILNGMLSLFQIDPAWFLTGIGEPTMNPSSAYHSKVQGQYDYIEALDNDENNPQTIGGFFISKSFIETHNLNSESLYVYSLTDNTMAPYIVPGEPVLVDISQNNITDGVFIIGMMQQKQIRRIQLRPDGIWITADNKTYDPIIISEQHLDKINIIGKVFKINQIIS